MKKTIFIHIGLHKTGTTTIQKSLFLNQDLLFKNGILIPKTGRTFPLSAGHHNLGWALKHNEQRFDERNGTWKNLLDEIKLNEKCSKVIISTESFTNLNENEIVQLRNILNDYETKIILCLRRQDQLLQSIWVQFVKFHNRKIKMPSFSRWIKEINYELPNTQFKKILNKWEKQFSYNNLIVSKFENLVGKKSLFLEFLSLCSINNFDYNEVPKMNVSPGVKTIEAIRLIRNNFTLEKFNHKDWSMIIRKVQKYGDENGWNCHKVNFLSEEITSHFFNFYEEENEFIANKYFGNNELFKKSEKCNKEFTDFCYDNFTNEQILSLLNYLLLELSVPPHMVDMIEGK